MDSVSAQASAAPTATVQMGRPAREGSVNPWGLPVETTVAILARFVVAQEIVQGHVVLRRIAFVQGSARRRRVWAMCVVAPP